MSTPPAVSTVAAATPSMENAMDWDTDGQGNVITRPLVGWDTATAAGIACVLRVRFAETPEKLKTGDLSRLPLVMSPAQALELAEDLRKTAERLLAEKPPQGHAPS